MIHIHRDKNGFRATTLATNGKVLNQTETETRKANIWKNIISDFQQVELVGKAEEMIRWVQDDTGEISKMYRLSIDLKTRKAIKIFDPVAILKAKYVPKRKRQ